MIHVERKTDIWISCNASGMNVTVAIFEEKPFDVAGFVEEDGT